MKKNNSPAYKLARKYGLPPEEAEHIENIVLAKKMMGGDLRQTIYLTIDAMREEYGDLRHSSGGFFKRVPVAKTEKGATALMYRTGFRAVDRLSIIDTVKCLDKIPRAAILLKYLWGFNLIEIGMLFGVSNCRVNQILKEALLFLKLEDSGEKSGKR